MIFSKGLNFKVESAKNAIVGLMAQKDGAKPATSIINTKTVGHSIEVSVSFLSSKQYL